MQNSTKIIKLLPKQRGSSSSAFVFRRQNQKLLGYRYHEKRDIERHTNYQRLVLQEL